MTRRLILLAAGIAAIGLAAPADSKPDFSGDWKLNVEKSEFGPMPPPTTLTRKITHKDPSVTFQEAQSGPMGDSNNDVKFTTDGQETPNTIKTPNGDIEMKIKGGWDGNVLTSDAKFDFQGMDIASNQRWTLSEDGKTMTVAQKISTSQGDFEMNYVFEKSAAEAAKESK